MYQRTSEEDFWRVVSIGKRDECWEWFGNIDPDGYGTMAFNGVCEAVEDLLRGFVFGNRKFAIHKTCKNKLCCNPYHLSVGSI